MADFIKKSLLRVHLWAQDFIQSAQQFYGVDTIILVLEMRKLSLRVIKQLAQTRLFWRLAGSKLETHWALSLFKNSLKHFGN